MRAAWLLAVALALAGTASADERERAVDGFAAQIIGDTTPGMAVLVMRNGNVLLAKGYGIADLESGAPVTADTIFDLASVSKQMTALMALKLSEEGALDLAAPLDQVLSGYRQHPGMRPVTVNDLIHHVAGLADYMEMWVEATTNAEVVAFASQAPPERAPGTDYAYSNTGYVLLASALAESAGTADLAALLRRDLFGPLHMEATAMPRPKPDLDAARLATGYDGEDGTFTFAMAPGEIQGDGSVMSSVNELAKYEAALAAGSILPKAALAKLFVPGRLDDGRAIDTGDGSSYGMGWDLFRWDGDDFAGHSGLWGGFAAYYLRDLTSGLSVVVLANCSGFDPASMAYQIAVIYDPP